MSTLGPLDFSCSCQWFGLKRSISLKKDEEMLECRWISFVSENVPTHCLKFVSLMQCLEIASHINKYILSQTGL